MILLARVAPWLWVGTRVRPRRWVVVGVVIGLVIVTWGALR